MDKGLTMADLKGTWVWHAPCSVRTLGACARTSSVTEPSAELDLWHPNAKVARSGLSGVAAAW